MPIFGLVWVASWVGCFFPSSQDLLQAPSHPSCVLASPSCSVNNSHSRHYPISTKANLALAVSHPIQATNVSDVKSIEEKETSSFSISSLLNIFSPTPTATTQKATQSVSSHSTGVAAKPTSENLLKAFKHLFQVAHVPSQVAHPVTVSQVKANPKTKAIEGSSSKAMGFGQCIVQPDAEGLPSYEPERFQVKLKGFTVGEFSSRKQATQVAQRLERFLSNSPSKVARIQPALVKGLPTVKWGDRVLFTLNQDMLQHFSCNPELLAIRWANNLRLALKEPTLTIVEAQEEMYGLQPTAKTLEGMASWYGPYFNGRQTATGETFDEKEFTAAHRSLPFDTYLRVTNVMNGKSVIVRINDRGPYFDNRTLDLSREAARSIESEETGVIQIEAVIMKVIPNRKGVTETVAQL